LDLKSGLNETLSFISIKCKDFRFLTGIIAFHSNLTSDFYIGQTRAAVTILFDERGMYVKMHFCWNHRPIDRSICDVANALENKQKKKNYALFDFSLSPDRRNSKHFVHF
jgi:hypothetical protein